MRTSGHSLPSWLVNLTLVIASLYENTAYIRMNRFGFRGGDWAVRPAGKTLRITDFTVRRGIPALSLLEPLRAFGDAHHQFVYGFNASRPGDGHLNAVDNRLSGRAVAAWLCQAEADGPGQI